MSSASPSPPAARYELLAPEHVPLSFTLADVGARFGAFLLDWGLLLAVLVPVNLILGFALPAGGVGRGLLVAGVVLVNFLLPTFYFPWGELRWHGRTPGKRALKLRVVARDGGPLSAGMVLARNLTRAFETFIPLLLLLLPADAGSPVERVAVLVWTLILLFLPLLNRHRARLGDLLAGTVVVNEPRVELLEDLAGEESGAARFAFTREQLDLYGIHELQVLEDVLRREFYDEATRALMADIAGRIQRKIGWDDAARPVSDPAAFLRAFYAAQRARLEHKLLLGRRQERKVR